MVLFQPVTWDRLLPTAEGGSRWALQGWVQAEVARPWPGAGRAAHRPVSVAPAPPLVPARPQPLPGSGESRLVVRNGPKEAHLLCREGAEEHVKGQCRRPRNPRCRARRSVGARPPGGFTPPKPETRPRSLPPGLLPPAKRSSTKAQFLPCCCVLLRGPGTSLGPGDVAGNRAESPFPLNAMHERQVRRQRTQSEGGPCDFRKLTLPRG